MCSTLALLASFVANMGALREAIPMLSRVLPRRLWSFLPLFSLLWFSSLIFYSAESRCPISFLSPLADGGDGGGHLGLGHSDHDSISRPHTVDVASFF